MDKTDVAIISALQADSRRSYSSLARELHLGISTVRRRVDRLLEEGVIVPTAVVSPFRMGLEGSALIGLKVALRQIDSVMEALSKEDVVHFVASVTGRFDIIVAVHCASQKELATFISTRLAAIEGIHQSETFIYMKIRVWNHHYALWQSGSTIV